MCLDDHDFKIIKKIFLMVHHEKTLNVIIDGGLGKFFVFGIASLGTPHPTPISDSEAEAIGDSRVRGILRCPFLFLFLGRRLGRV